MNALTVLYVGHDGPEIDRILERVRSDGLDYAVTVAPTLSSAINRLDRGPFDCVVLERSPNGESTKAVIRRIEEVVPEMPIVIWSEAEEVPSSRTVSAIQCADPAEVVSAIKSLFSPPNTAETADRFTKTEADASRILASEGTASVTTDHVVMVCDRAGALIEWNDRLTEIVGYDDHELRSMMLEDLVPEDDRKVIVEILEEPDSVSRREFHLETTDGDRLLYEIVCSQFDSTRIPIVGRNVSHRRAVERELEEAIDELERSNAELERFAYAASHDLKEPLRMVTSYLELIERRYGHALDEDAEAFIEYAIDGAQRMRRMIDGLLTYSRIGRSDVEFERVDCEEVLERVIENLAISVAETEATVTVDSLPTVRGDFDQLVQLFQNLVKNGIRYAGEEPPRIHVTATRTDDPCIISVRDEGIGIAADEKDRIFELFYGSAGKNSTGIGLATAKKIVTRHDGRIWVDSEPGDGSTFFVSLPTSDDGDEVEGELVPGSRDGVGDAERIPGDELGD